MGSISARKLQRVVLVKNVVCCTVARVRRSSLILVCAIPSGVVGAVMGAAAVGYVMAVLAGLLCTAAGAVGLARREGQALGVAAACSGVASIVAGLVERNLAVGLCGAGAVAAILVGWLWAPGVVLFSTVAVGAAGFSVGGGVATILAVCVAVCASLFSLLASSTRLALGGTLLVGVALVCGLVFVPEPPSSGTSAQALGLKQVEMRRCGTLTNDMGAQLHCYEDYFAGVRVGEGVDAALEQLVALHSSSDGKVFSQYCHEVLHTLGIGAMKDAEDPLSVFDHLKITCTGGFAHGALSAYFERLGSDQVVAQHKELCSSLVDRLAGRLGKEAEETGWLSWNCDHMLGHALYLAHVPDPVVGAKLCADFADGSGARTNCMAGFYMEYFLKVGREPESEAAKQTPAGVGGTFYLCENVDQGVARGCYSELGGVLYQRVGFDWAKAAAACDEFVHDQDFKLACYEGLGRNVAAYSGYDTAEMRAGCAALGNTVASETCSVQIAGAEAMELADAKSGLLICAEDIADSERKKACEMMVNGTAAELQQAGFGGGVANDWTSSAGT